MKKLKKKFRPIPAAMGNISRYCSWKRRIGNEMKTPSFFSEFLKNCFPPTQISDASSISTLNYKSVIRIWIYEITWPHLAWGSRRICIDWILSFLESQFITQWAPSVTYPLTPKAKLNWRHWLTEFLMIEYPSQIISNLYIRSQRFTLTSDGLISLAGWY